VLADRISQDVDSEDEAEPLRVLQMGEAF